MSTKHLGCLSRDGIDLDADFHPLGGLIHWFVIIFYWYHSANFYELKMDENSFNQNDKTDYIACEKSHILYVKLILEIDWFL